MATIEASKTAVMNRRSPKVRSPTITRGVGYMIEGVGRRGRRVMDRRY